MTTTPEAAVERLRALQDWLREPDHADTFGHIEILDWINRRPTHIVSQVLAVLAPSVPSIPEGEKVEPIDMVLHCPACHAQHIDEPVGEWDGKAWDNPPHRSHLCHACGCIWRPADVPTNGVRETQTRGKADTYVPTANPSIDGAAEVERLREALRFYADLANPRAWVQHTVTDAQHSDGRRPIGQPVPSEALLADRGTLARAALTDRSDTVASPTDGESQ